MKPIGENSCDIPKLLRVAEVGMPRIQYPPDKAGFDVKENETFLEATLRANIVPIMLVEVSDGVLSGVTRRHPNC